MATGSFQPITPRQYAAAAAGSRPHTYPHPTAFIEVGVRALIFSDSERTLQKIIWMSGQLDITVNCR